MITRDALKERETDFLLAYIEDGQLVMEPFCHCGAALDESYRCPECNRPCECRFVACADPQAMAVVEKLISGNPRFRGFDLSLLDD